MIGNSAYTLIPTTANIKAEADLEFEAVNVQRLLAYLDEAETKLNIVILDACRDNPFKSVFRSVGSKGLTRVQRPRGTLVAYATRENDVAADGAGTHSPYTAALRRYLKQPGLTVQDMFNEVGREVLAATDNEQEPWISASVLPKFCFAGCAGGGTVIASAPSPQPVPVPAPMRHPNEPESASTG